MQLTRAVILGAGDKERQVKTREQETRASKQASEQASKQLTVVAVEARAVQVRVGVVVLLSSMATGDENDKYVSRSYQ